MKKCSKCGSIKPIDAFYKDGAGHRADCKDCNKASRQQYYHEHCDERRQYDRERAALPKRVMGRKHSYCKHRNKRLEAMRHYRHTNRVALNTRARQLYKNNNKRKTNMAWRKAHKDKMTLYYKQSANLRRARKHHAGGVHNATDIRRQGEVQKWRCWWCGEDCKDKYHTDHLVPLSRGGHNGPTNLVISCPHCNLSKHDQLPSEWTGRLL